MKRSRHLFKKVLKCCQLLFYPACVVFGTYRARTLISRVILTWFPQNTYTRDKFECPYLEIAQRQLFSLLKSEDKTASKVMANMRSKNRAFACHTKLPQLRRKYTIQSPMLQVFGEENFPSRFLRLRRIERCPLVQSKTALPFRGDEENMYPCLTIDEQSQRFCQVVKKCGKAFARVDGFKELNKTEKASTRSEIRMKDGASRACNYSSKKERAQILPENVFRRPVHLLRRHLKPERVYRKSNGPMSHEELLAFDQNMDQLRVFTERDVKWAPVKDFSQWEKD